MARTFDEPNSSSAPKTASTPLHEPNIRMPGDGAYTSSQTTEPESTSYANAAPDTTPQAPTNFKELQTVLQQMDSNFIFPVGMGQAGKTVALYSMLRHLMTKDSPGQLYPVDSPWKAVDKTGVILSEVATMFRESKLPKSTQVIGGNVFEDTKQANYEFAPSNKRFPNLRMTFVDFSGENYKDFLSTERFPAGIDAFFQVGGLSLTFLLMTSHEHAAKDDHLFSLFLGHIAKQDPAFRNARAAIVLTKWDTYKGKDSVDQFIEKWMPMTYASTRNPSNALMCFTVGSVGKDADGKTEWLKQFNPAPAAALFKWIYQSITRVNLDAKPWWQRFLKGI
jgi:hypothetical protein